MPSDPDKRAQGNRVGAGVCLRVRGRRLRVAGRARGGVGVHVAQHARQVGHQQRVMMQVQTEQAQHAQLRLAKRRRRHAAPAALQWMKNGF